MKSQVASAAVKEMNPALNIQAWVTKVATETENVYNVDFWRGLTGEISGLFPGFCFISRSLADERTDRNRRLQRARQCQRAAVR